MRLSTLQIDYLKANYHRAFYLSTRCPLHIIGNTSPLQRAIYESALNIPEDTTPLIIVSTSFLHLRKDIPATVQSRMPDAPFTKVYINGALLVFYGHGPLAHIHAQLSCCG